MDSVCTTCRHGWVLHGSGIRIDTERKRENCSKCGDPLGIDSVHTQKIVKCKTTTFCMVWISMRENETRREVGKK